MDKEINAFLNKEFANELQEWVQLSNENKKQFSYEIFEKIKHIEEIISKAVSYKFSEKPDANLKMYRYLGTL